MEKKDYLGNVKTLKFEVLLDAIIKKEITLDEIKKTGKLDPQKRQEIESGLEKLGELDDRAYNECKKINDYQKYLEDFPEGKNAEKAHKKYNMYKKAKSDILEKIRINTNSYSLHQIVDFLKKEIISEDDLLNNESGIDEDIIKLLRHEKIKVEIAEKEKAEVEKEKAERGKKEVLGKTSQGKAEFKQAELERVAKEKAELEKKEAAEIEAFERAVSGNDTLENGKIKIEVGVAAKIIPFGYTEVYLWGLPGSGKTCALAALLRTADNSSINNKECYVNIESGSGYEYADSLKNIFIPKEAYLPDSTNAEQIQCLQFSLKAGKDSPRKIAFIELSGELFEYFYDINSEKQLITEDEENKLKTEQIKATFNILKGYLNSENRKIHFFFVDYEKGNNFITEKGAMQEGFLRAASTYFKDNEIFSKSTDAIYLVVTKSDLIKHEKNEDIKVKAEEFLKTNNYSSFYNSLKDQCEINNINGGKLDIETLSIGKVYFQRICRFNEESPKNILKILIDRINPGKKQTIINTIIEYFNK